MGTTGWCMMSTLLCLYPAKLHTDYEQKHEERPWAQHSSSIWWPHILPVSEQTRGYDKHIARHLSVHITYILSTKNTSHDGHIYLDPTDEPTYQLWANTQDTIRPSIRICMMRSLTHCRRKYEDAEWVGHSRSIRGAHALSVGKNTTRHHKLSFLHLLN